jgi:hypothetical protein
MAARSDAALVTAARGGDRDAFAALVERHQPALLRACRGSADAAQEAVLQALRGLGGLRDEHAFGAWLCGIGRNLARHEPRPPPPPITAEPSTTLDQGSDPFVRERVLGAVAALPPGQREAVALFYLADLSHAQIAARLGISVGAVKTRLHKARAALQTRLIDLRREPTVTMSTPVPMRVAEIRETEGDTHIVLLEEVDGVRRVPIWIARAEAEALSMRLKEIERPRPGTYRFTADLLAAAGAELQEVRIVRLAETIFYAEAVLAGGVRVDARPSDALNLALETGAPVVAEDAVVAAAAMSEAQIAEEIAQSLARR